MSGDKSFVIADIPGLIEGASEGAGLGIRFLKHLTRTRLLLHLVDMMPYDGSTPDQNAVVIEKELERFSPTLASGDRWLVLNKIDLLPEDEVDGLCERVVEQLGWEGPVFRMSGLASQGTKVLVRGHHGLHRRPSSARRCRSGVDLKWPMNDAPSFKLRLEIE